MGERGQEHELIVLSHHFRAGIGHHDVEGNAVLPAQRVAAVSVDQQVAHSPSASRQG